MIKFISIPLLSSFESSFCFNGDHNGGHKDIKVTFFRLNLGVVHFVGHPQRQQSNNPLHICFLFKHLNIISNHFNFSFSVSIPFCQILFFVLHNFVVQLFLSEKCIFPSICILDYFPKMVICQICNIIISNTIFVGFYKVFRSFINIFVIFK